MIIFLIFFPFYYYFFIKFFFESEEINLLKILEKKIKRKRKKTISLDYVTKKKRSKNR